MLPWLAGVPHEELDLVRVVSRPRRKTAGCSRHVRSRNWVAAIEEARGAVQGSLAPLPCAVGHSYEPRRAVFRAGVGARRGADSSAGRGEAEAGERRSDPDVVRTD